MPNESEIITNSEITSDANDIASNVADIGRITTETVNKITTNEKTDYKIAEEAVLEMESMEQRIIQMESKFETDKTSLLTIFGIFASIVIFLSMEFQILKNICNYDRLLGLSLFTLGGLLSFILILQYIVKSWIEKDEIFTIRKALLLVADWKSIGINISLMFAILAVIVCFAFGNKFMKSAVSEVNCNQQQVIDSGLNDVRMQFSGELQVLRAEGGNNSDAIKNIEKNLNNLQKKIETPK